MGVDAAPGAARRTPEVVVFSVAIAAALLHALDDAFLHRGPGVGLGQHALAAAVALVLGARRDLRVRVRAPRGARRDGLLLRCARDRQRCPARQAHRRRVARRGRSDGCPRARRRRRAGRPRRRDPVAPSRRGLRRAPPALGAADHRRARRAHPRLLHRRPHRHRAHRDAQVSRADRRSAQRGLSRGRLRRRRRRPPLGLVSPDAQRGDDHRAPRRWRRPQWRGRPCQGPGPPRLWRAALRRPRAREERRDPERVRLGLDQGHRGRPALPEGPPRGRRRAHRGPGPVNRRRHPRPGRRRGREPPRRRRRRDGRGVLRGLAAPAGDHRAHAVPGRRVRHGQDHLGHEVRAAAAGHDRAHLLASDARLGRPRRGVPLQRQVRPRRRRAPSRALEPPRRASTPAPSVGRRPSTSAA